MKVLPFKIPKPDNTALFYQEDHEVAFYEKLHQHEEFQFSLIAQGEGTLIVGDTVNEYHAGDIIILGDNLPHVFKSETNASSKSLMVTLFLHKQAFGERFFQLQEFASLNSFFKDCAFGIKLLSHKEQVRSAFLKLKTADALERFTLFFEILKLIQLAQYKTLASFIYRKNYKDIEGKRMSAVFDYTLSHYSKDISLSQIASIASMTTNAFCKYFKQRTNKRYFQFLAELRIEQACKLFIKQPDKSIAEIAHLVGFNNISNFNRRFKNCKKMTPMQFKNSQINL